MMNRNDIQNYWDYLGDIEHSGYTPFTRISLPHGVKIVVFLRFTYFDWFI